MAPAQRALQPLAEPVSHFSTSNEEAKHEAPERLDRPSALYRWEGDDLVVKLPVRTKNEANLSSPHARFALASYRKSIRKMVKRTLLACPHWTSLPVTVTLTRFGAGRVDAHDGLPNCFKSVVDEIAEWLPLPKKPHAVRTKQGLEKRLRADDSDARVTWLYWQEKAPPGTGFVIARFSPRKDDP